MDKADSGGSGLGSLVQLIDRLGSWIAHLVEEKWGDVIGLMLVLVGMHYAIHFNANEVIKDLCEKVIAAGLIIIRPSSWRKTVNGGNNGGNNNGLPPTPPPAPRHDGS